MSKHLKLIKNIEKDIENIKRDKETLGKFYTKGSSEHAEYSKTITEKIKTLKTKQEQLQEYVDAMPDDPKPVNKPKIVKIAKKEDTITFREYLQIGVSLAALGVGIFFGGPALMGEIDRFANMRFKESKAQIFNPKYETMTIEQEELRSEIYATKLAISIKKRADKIGKELKKTMSENNVNSKGIDTFLDIIEMKNAYQDVWTTYVTKALKDNFKFNLDMDLFHLSKDKKNNRDIANPDCVYVQSLLGMMNIYNDYKGLDHIDELHIVFNSSNTNKVSNGVYSISAEKIGIKEKDLISDDKPGSVFYKDVYNRYMITSEKLLERYERNFQNEAKVSFTKVKKTTHKI